MDRYKSAKTSLIYCGLAVITFCTLFPLLWGLSASFRSDSELFQYALPFSIKTLLPVEFTVEAYVRLFTEFGFLRYIRNTVIVTFSCILLGTTVNSIAAFSFATFDFKFKKIIFGFVLMSFMIPFEAIALPLFKVVDGFGLVDTRAALIVPGIADGLVLFLFTQFFRDLPPSLIEAARVDGASYPTIFIKIIFPLSLPVFITAGLMIFMNQWNAYLWPLLAARDKEIQVIQTALAAFRGERATLWSCLYAGSMISAIIPLLLFLPLQKYFVQGITSSGIKG